MAQIIAFHGHDSPGGGGDHYSMTVHGHAHSYSTSTCAHTRSTTQPTYTVLRKPSEGKGVATHLVYLLSSSHLTVILLRIRAEVERCCLGISDSCSLDSAMSTNSRTDDRAYMRMRAFGHTCSLSETRGDGDVSMFSKYSENGTVSYCY